MKYMLQKVFSHTDAKNARKIALDNKGLMNFFI